VFLKKWVFLPRYQKARAFFRKLRIRQFLHRYIVQLAGLNWPEVGFKNGNPFDCRLDNLYHYDRKNLCSQRKLSRNNSTGFPGVYLKKSTGRWAACLKFQGRLHHLGYFMTPQEAAKAHSKKKAQLQSRP
jgi:hypothetical protein